MVITSLRLNVPRMHAKTHRNDFDLVGFFHEDLGFHNYRLLFLGLCFWLPILERICLIPWEHQTGNFQRQIVLWERGNWLLALQAHKAEECRTECRGMRFTFPPWMGVLTHLFYLNRGDVQVERGMLDYQLRFHSSLISVHSKVDEETSGPTKAVRHTSVDVQGSTLESHFVTIAPKVGIDRLPICHLHLA